MNIWLSIGIGILSSFLASLIFFYSSDYIKRKSSQVIDWVSSINRTYSNRFYYDLARNKNFYVEILPAFTILILVFSIGFYGNLKYHDRYKVLEEIKTEIDSGKTFDSISFNKRIKELENLQKFEKGQTVMSNFYVFTAAKYFFIGLAILITIHIYFRIVKWMKIKDQNQEFNYQLTLLCTEIPEKEILTLKSKWAQMRSKTDFDEIVNAILEYHKRIELNKPTPNKVQNENTP